MPDHVASVFVSHAHADEPYVRQFCSRLGDGGCWVWIDEDQLPGGVSLSEGLSDAIDQVDFCVALVSTKYVGSEWCRWELSLAVSTGIRRGVVFVLPVRVDDTPIPKLLRDRRYLDVRGMTPRQAADKVMNSVREHVRPTRVIPPRRVQPSVGPLPKTPNSTARSPRRRARQSVLLGAVLALLSIGPVSPVASVSVVEPGQDYHLPYY